MRYFSYAEFDGTNDSVETKSEHDIYVEYYPYWLERMYAKYGKEHVEENYTFQDCLDDWIVVNWAWEVTI